MIAVIADDLTGAAEIAGIGLKYCLKTELCTVVERNCNADLLIIATDTRSLPETEARKVMAELTTQLSALKPKLIFKKIDSVLRGHILQEVEGQLAASGSKRALIITGNPLHDKKVVDGVYYYQDKPIHLSSYAHDPAFPCTTSNVMEMLRADGPVKLLKIGEELPQTGIAIGQVCCEDDLDHWVKQADRDTLLAGASGLFDNLLHHLFSGETADHTIIDMRARRLFVFGSTFFQGQLPVADGLLNNIAVHFIPPSIIFDEENKEQLIGLFAGRVAASIFTEGNAIIAVDPDAIGGLKIDPASLGRKITAIAKQIIQCTTVHELLIEGGATAWSILNLLNFKKLHPVNQLSPGVIRLSIPGNNQLYVTLKPGSYEWPARVWQTN